MFWIKVDVKEKGDVVVTTYDNSGGGYPCSPVRSRSATTVSQALRLLAAAMVHAKAETVAQQPSESEATA